MFTLFFLVIWIGLEAYGIHRFGFIAFKKRLYNTLVGIDQTANAFLLYGDPDETISGHAAKNMHMRGFHQLGNLLEKLDPGHLAWAIEEDEGKDAAAKFPGEK